MRMWQRLPDGTLRRRVVSDKEEKPGVPEASGEAPPGRRVPFWRTVRRALAETYDYLGTVLLISLLVTLIAVAVGLAIGGLTASILPARPSDGAPAVPLFLLALFLTVTLLGPLLAGVYGLVRLIVAREDPAPADLFLQARRHAGAGAGLAALQAGVGLLLFVDLLFFAASPLVLLKVAAVLCAYALLLWGLMLPYQWPLLVEGAGPPLKVVKKSFLLVLDNFPFSVDIALGSLLFTFLCAATTVGLVLLWPGVLAFLHTVALRELLRKYGVLPPADGGGSDDAPD